jgi:hypothetical protein
MILLRIARGAFRGAARADARRTPQPAPRNWGKGTVLVITMFVIVGGIVHFTAGGGHARPVAQVVAAAPTGPQGNPQCADLSGFKASTGATDLSAVGGDLSLMSADQKAGNYAAAYGTDARDLVTGTMAALTDPQPPVADAAYRAAMVSYQGAAQDDQVGLTDASAVLMARANADIRIVTAAVTALVSQCG